MQLDVHRGLPGHGPGRRCTMRFPAPSSSSRSTFPPLLIDLTKSNWGTTYSVPAGRYGPYVTDGAISVDRPVSRRARAPTGPERRYTEDTNRFRPISEVSGFRLLPYRSLTR